LSTGEKIPSPRHERRDRDRLARAQRRLARTQMGRDLVVIGRWYPSSKTCSACGRLAASLPLGAREWDCAHCGTRHDRDINAAVNIKAAGLAVLACGAGTRPEREPSRAGSRP
jgi:transposase